MGKVRNILQTKGNAIISVEPQDTVYYALELMCEKNVGALLVLREGRFAGLFTERDYARKVILKGKASKETLVGEIMTENVATVTPDTPIEECMQLMTRSYIRHLPVLEGQELKGLISIGDLVKYIIDEQKFIIENLEHFITGR
ncbi:MAG: CBS domain-containing protein [Adhaeribacter sp.]